MAFREFYYETDVFRVKYCFGLSRALVFLHFQGHANSETLQMKASIRSTIEKEKWWVTSPHDITPKDQGLKSKDGEYAALGKVY